MLLERAYHGFNQPNDMTAILPVYTYNRVMGAAAADECLSLLYRDTSVHPYECVPARNVLKFLSVDFFGRGFQIMYWIKTLYIHWADKDNPKRVLRSLKPMANLDFPKPVAVELQIDWSYLSSQDRNYSLILKLEAFRPVFETLTRRRHKVTIREGNSNIDIMNFYTMSNKAWLMEMRAPLEYEGEEEQVPGMIQCAEVINRRAWMYRRSH